MATVQARLHHASYFDEAWFEAEQKAIAAQWWVCDAFGTDGLAFSRSTPSPSMGEGRGGGDGAGQRREHVSLAAATPPPGLPHQGGGEALTAQLAPFAAWLAAATAHAFPPDRTGRVEIDANWKLLVENTLDDCHGGTLHAHSLQPSFPEWRTAFRCERHGANSAITHVLGEADRDFWAKLVRRLNVHRFGTGEDYRHVFLFPNVYVSTFFDALVMVHRIVPLGPTRSALEWSLSLPLHEPPTGAKRAILKAVLADLVAKAGKVIDEDLAICRLAQAGRAYAVHPGLFGERELRAADFQAVLRETMG